MVMVGIAILAFLIVILLEGAKESARMEQEINNALNNAQRIIVDKVLAGKEYEYTIQWWERNSSEKKTISDVPAWQFDPSSLKEKGFKKRYILDRWVWIRPDAAFEE